MCIRDSFSTHKNYPTEFNDAQIIRARSRMTLCVSEGIMSISHIFITFRSEFFEIGESFFKFTLKSSLNWTIEDLS